LEKFPTGTEEVSTRDPSFNDFFFFSLCAFSTFRRFLEKKTVAAEMILLATIRHWKAAEIISA
jgi:hypothetical protein